MLEQRQDPALLQEAAEHARRAPLDELDRGALLELAVGPLAQVHRPHPAPAEQPDDTPRAHLLRNGALGWQDGAEQRLRWRQRGLEEALAAVRVQQTQHLRVDLGVVARCPLGERHLLVGGDVEEGVEDGVDAAVAVGGQGGHQWSKMRPGHGLRNDGSRPRRLPQSPGERPSCPRPGVTRCRAFALIRRSTPRRALPPRPHPSSWPTWPCSPPVTASATRSASWTRTPRAPPSAGWSAGATSRRAGTSSTTSAGTPAARTSAPTLRTRTSSAGISWCRGRTAPASTSSTPSPIRATRSWSR